VNKQRLEAFSDGVIAIIITVMVLEMKVPHGTAWVDLRPLIPVFVSYALSFLFLGIYWSNHHHLCQAIRRVDGRTLWANLHLLFWLSLIPFVTSWMGEHRLPGGQRTMLWIMRNMPSSSATILDRARRYYQELNRS